MVTFPKLEILTGPARGQLMVTVPKGTGLSQDAVAPRNAGEDEAGNRKSSEPDNGDVERQAGQPNYVARVSLDATTVQTENGIMPIEPGGRDG